MTNLENMKMISPLKVSVTPCVYNTQFPGWLEAGPDRPASDLLCFRSNKRWVTAARLLNDNETLPILVRKQEDSSAALACRFVADLVAIQFADQLGNDAKQRAWLDEKLWFQRELIKGSMRDYSFATWEEQFKNWEIDNFMLATTWYSIRHLREIKPLPLP